MSVWDSDELGIGVDAWLAVDEDDAHELPEVSDARKVGWEPAPEAPLWCFLPAVWPRHHRAWAPDRRIRHSTYSCSDRTSGRVPWGTWTYAEIEADYNRTLAVCGFAPRPFGRIWLLRVVPPWGSVDGLLEEVVADWGMHHHVIADREFAEHTRVQLEHAFAL